MAVLAVRSAAREVHDEFIIIGGAAVGVADGDAADRDVTHDPAVGAERFEFEVRRAGGELCREELVVRDGRPTRDLAAAGLNLFIAAEDGVKIWNWCGGDDYEILPNGSTEALAVLDGVRLVALPCFK